VPENEKYFIFGTVDVCYYVGRLIRGKEML
jgi:hypothetical protein